MNTPLVSGNEVQSLLPLLVATALLIAGLVVPRLALRWPLWLRLLMRIGFFVALTGLVQRILGSPLQPRFSNLSAEQHFWAQLIEASWWIAGANVGISFARLFVVLENRPRETRIVSDLLAGALSVATFLAIVNFAFAVPIRGLLATSGVIAIVLGLALQSTLSDVFSGIAVGLERPYKPGDLLWVEGGIEGHVIQVNWRSTQIVTGDDNVAIVPNSVIAKARLVNRSAPSTVRGSSVSIALDATAFPERCIAALTAAAQSCDNLRARPAPGISCTGLAGDGATYEIGFSVDSTDRLGAARTELFTQVHRHLRNAGIALAVPNSATPPALAAPTLSVLLQQSDLFGVIPAEDREHLAAFFKPQWLKPGETLIRQDDMPEAMFLVASGAAEITVADTAGPRIVHRTGPGECLGAIGLITGKTYAATATALTPLHAYRISKAELADAIRTKPELATALEALAKRGQDALRRDLTVNTADEPDRPEMFLGRLKNFLHLLAS